MGLKVCLTWYDKKTELFVGDEYSKDFGTDGTVVENLGLPIQDNINNGEFDVQHSWVALLQAHFKTTIDLSKYDYQVGFIYKDGTW